MIKFYVRSVIQHPLTGEADNKIFEVIEDCPKLEAVLRDSRAGIYGDDRMIIDLVFVDGKESGK